MSNTSANQIRHIASGPPQTPPPTKQKGQIHFIKTITSHRYTQRPPMSKFNKGHQGSRDFLLASTTLVQISLSQY